MDGQSSQTWQELYRRHTNKEPLTESEAADYQAGCRELEASEVLDGNIERLRQLRAQIAEADAEHEILMERKRRNDARIAELEARLDPRTRQLLGIEG